ncbi:MAG: drug/metabolite transporter (DMT)-like permease [Halieaceae bacterium]|jgi:drug/metabolite transporter (DMT)-like permease
MSFGILSTIVKLAYASGFRVDQVVTSQLWLGAIICWILVFILNVTKKPTPLAKGTWWKILIGGFPLGITSFAYYQCVEYVPASIAILLLFQFVWMGVVLDILFKRKLPTTPQIMSVLILLLGTFLAAGILDNPEMEWSVAGIGFGLLAALGYAIFIYVNGDAGETHFLVSAALRATGGALFSILFFSPITGLDNLFTNGLLAYGAPLAIFGMVIPPIFFAWGIPKIGTTESSILSGIELPIAVLSASFILHEHVSWVQWSGVFVILTAISYPQLIALRKKK